MFLFSLLLLLLFKSIFLSQSFQYCQRIYSKHLPSSPAVPVVASEFRLSAGKREEYVAYFLIENTENVNVVIYFVISRQAATRVRRRTNFLTLTY